MLMSNGATSAPLDLEPRSLHDVGQTEPGQVNPESILRRRPEQVQRAVIDIATGDSIEQAEIGVNGSFTRFGHRSHVDLAWRATEPVATSGTRSRRDEFRTTEGLHQAANRDRADARHLTDRIGTRVATSIRCQEHQDPDRLVQSTRRNKLHESVLPRAHHYHWTNELAIFERLRIATHWESIKRSPYQSDRESLSTRIAGPRGGAAARSPGNPRANNGQGADQYPVAIATGLTWVNRVR